MKNNPQICRREWLRISATLSAAWAIGSSGYGQTKNRRVLVWSEKTAPKDVYPNDINGAIAEGLKTLPGWDVATANIGDPEQGCSQASLDKTDVLIWWGHKRHGEVKDEYVKRVVKRVKEEGMGFISVHSSHFAKPNKVLMGTPCTWRNYEADGSAVKIIVADPKHPIAKGIKDFTLPKTERYGDPYAVPKPEAVVFECIYYKPDGKEEKAQQGLCWTIGKGKFFYFQTGHETYPDLFRDDVRQIFRNAVLWAAPQS